MPEFSLVLEDDVLCTEDGYEWFTEFIPREIKDIERTMAETGIGETFLNKTNYRLGLLEGESGVLAV